MLWDIFWLKFHQLGLLSGTAVASAPEGDSRKHSTAFLSTAAAANNIPLRHLKSPFFISLLGLLHDFPKYFLQLYFNTLSLQDISDRKHDLGFGI